MDTDPTITTRTDGPPIEDLPPMQEAGPRPEPRFEPHDVDLEIPDQPIPAHQRPASVAHRFVEAAQSMRTYDDGTALGDLKEALAARLEGIPEDRRAEWLWLLAGQADTWIRAAKLARAAIEYHQLEDIDRNGDVRFGDQGLRVKPSRTRKLHEPDALIDWLRETGGTDSILEAFRHDDSNLRITAVRHLAAQHYRADCPDAPDEDVDDFVEMIEDTFFGWEDTGHQGRKLDSIPVTKAKWVAELGHGDRRPRKGTK